MARKPKPEETPVDDRGPAPDLEEALNRVMEEVPYVQKVRQAGSGRYAYTYAGDADLIAALRPAMLRHRVSMRPSAVEMLYHEQYQAKSDGGTLNRIVLLVSYKVVHATSKETDTVQAVGEGADIGDKASAKAMTFAHKIALKQLFNIETGNEPDETPSEDLARRDAQPAQQATQQPAGDTKTNGVAQPPATTGRPSKEALTKALAAVASAPNANVLSDYERAFEKRGYKDDQLNELRQAAHKRRDELTKAAAAAPAN